MPFNIVGAVEASVVNLFESRHGNTAINVYSRLAQMLKWGGANVVPVETQPGKNASFDQMRHLITTLMYCVLLLWNETSTGTD